MYYSAQVELEGPWDFITLLVRGFPPNWDSARLLSLQYTYVFFKTCVTRSPVAAPSLLASLSKYKTRL